MPECEAVTVAVPGTCGELIQGWSAAWDRAVLVSCPIALYSRATVRLRPSPEIATPGGDYPKSRRAVRLALDDLERPDLGATVTLASQLVPGLGMGSSTADVVGVMAGVSTALGRPMPPARLAQLACQIEPSDSTMFPDLTLLAYRDQGQSETLGPALPLPLLMLVPAGGQPVDTLAFNAGLDPTALRRLAPTTQTAIETLRWGLLERDPTAIGAAATLSAESYQSISHSDFLPQARAWATATGAAGVVRAHSGSVVGLLYPLDTNLDEPARWLAARFEGVITPTHLVGGGKS